MRKGKKKREESVSLSFPFRQIWPRVIYNRPSFKKTRSGNRRKKKKGAVNGKQFRFDGEEEGAERRPFHRRAK